ncbi:hypothetical protein Glove_365g104 [Diversispora epigaea]|uniref:TLDc domain-containing protein n=1 Tax=Diversispora epigaea TaxID=1348612 RepID=A0A397H7J0_9GLOM|nr:hypothetical protein Glove_365g104 [Diversispora epigaea]
MTQNLNFPINLDEFTQKNILHHRHILQQFLPYFRYFIFNCLIRPFKLILWGSRDVLTPQIIWDICHDHVKLSPSSKINWHHVICGWKSTIAATQNGTAYIFERICYGWGSNGYGQLRFLTRISGRSDHKQLGRKYEFNKIDDTLNGKEGWVSKPIPMHFLPQTLSFTMSKDVEIEKTLI